MAGNEELTTRIHRCLHGETPGEHIDADEAAGLLEEARARIEELEGALRHYAQEAEHDHGGPVWDGGDRARAALNTKDQGNG